MRREDVVLRSMEFEVESRCLYCEFVARSVWEEIEHMQQNHQLVINARLREAGFIKNLNGMWVDTLADESTWLPIKL